MDETAAPTTDRPSLTEICNEAVALHREHFGRGPGAAKAHACHARAPQAGDTDWVRIAALYEALASIAPSPVVELNRAVAIAMAFGPEPALELVDLVAAEPAMREYHLVPSVRGDLLARLGRGAEAAAEFRRAAELTANERERALLLRRASEATAEA